MSFFCFLLLRRLVSNDSIPCPALYILLSRLACQQRQWNIIGIKIVFISDQKMTRFFPLVNSNFFISLMKFWQQNVKKNFITWFSILLVTISKELSKQGIPNLWYAKKVFFHSQFVINRTKNYINLLHKFVASNIGSFL